MIIRIFSRVDAFFFLSLTGDRNWRGQPLDYTGMAEVEIPGLSCDLQILIEGKTL